MTGSKISLLVLALSAGLGACAGEPPPEPVPIVLVSIDTVRSDHLPAYGYDSVATPAIDRLVADGLVFERAFAHVPITLPSHVSLLSGTLPSRHGIRDNLGYRVPPELPWLPQMLRQRGYATGGAVSTAVLGRSTGMARGFDFYDDGQEPSSPGGAEEEPEDEEQRAAQSYRAGAITVERALDWLDGVDRPLWFLFVQLYEPHRPYEPPEPFASRYDSPYDGEIATADAALGALLEGLDRRGLYEGSLIVLTSDHGEGLGEHGERDHGLFVYRESLQVPLVLKLPRSRLAGRRLARPVQLVDVVPTVLARIEGTVEPDAAGSSLLGDDGTERSIYAESYLPRLYYGASALHTLIGKRFQYIDSPSPELYDLLEDPGSRDNLIGQDPELVELYRQRIEQLTSELEPPGPIDEEASERLVSLGYLEAAASSAALPAPRQRIDVLRLLQAAYDAFGAGRVAEARETYLEAVERAPRAALAWAQLGQVERALDNAEASLDAMVMAARLSDYAAFRLLPTARLALRLGKLEVAEDLARRALDWHPAEAKGVLARVRLRQGKPEDARVLVLEALEDDPSWTGPALNLMGIYLRTRRPQDALQLADDIEARITEPAFGLDLLIGDALVRLGRSEEAVEWVEKEVALFPDRPRAYGYLATLYGSLDRPEEAGNAIDRLLASVSGPDKYVTGVRALLQLGFAREALELLARGREEFPESPELKQLEAALEPASG